MNKGERKLFFPNSVTILTYQVKVSDIGSEGKHDQHLGDMMVALSLSQTLRAKFRPLGFVTNFAATYTLLTRSTGKPGYVLLLQLLALVEDGFEGLIRLSVKVFLPSSSNL